MTTGEQLRSFISRIETLEAEKAALSGDIKEVYGEAKSAGYEPKIMRALVRIRKMNEADAQEQEELLEVYKRACGMLPDEG